MESFFNEYIQKIKEEIVENLPNTFSKIQELLSESSPLFNEIILIKGRYNELEKKVRNGVLKQDEEEVSKNRIRKSTIDLVSKISLSDTRKIESSNADTLYLINFIEENTELKINAKKYKSLIISLKKENHALIEKLDSISSKEKSNSNPTLVELKKFKFNYWTTFHYFPKLYEQINIATDEKYAEPIEAAATLTILTQNKTKLKYLKKFKSCFNEIRKIQNQNEFMLSASFDLIKKITDLEAFRRTFDSTMFKDIQSKLDDAEALKVKLYDRGFFSN